MADIIVLSPEAMAQLPRSELLVPLIPHTTTARTTAERQPHWPFPEQSLLTDQMRDAILSYVPPTHTRHARWKPFPDLFIGGERPGLAHMKRHRERMDDTANEALQNLGFRMFQVALVVEALVQLAVSAATAIQVVEEMRAAGRIGAGGSRLGDSVTDLTGGKGGSPNGKGRGGPGSPPGEGATVIVELGAGDLKASEHLARRGARVIAVDPKLPSAANLEAFKAAGGNRFIKGTAADVAGASADHVVWHYPFPISGSGGKILEYGTLEAIDEMARIARPNGVLTVVTECEETALYFLERAARQKEVELVRIVGPAGQLAPGASGAGIPDMSPEKLVYMVNVYLSPKRTLKLPAVPPGITTADFGQKIMKWGQKSSEIPRQRAKTITKEELVRNGVTREMAAEWRDFYSNEAILNKNNPSASGRAELMQRCVELLSE